MTNSRAQRLIDEFNEGAAGSIGGYSVRHGLAAVLLTLCSTEADEESFYAIPQNRLQQLAADLTAPTLLDRAIAGDANAARQFLREAGFTDERGQWLPQFQPPSLKEQASESLDKVVECLKMLVPGASVDGVHIETIRRALEALDD